MALVFFACVCWIQYINDLFLFCPFFLPTLHPHPIYLIFILFSSIFIYLHTLNDEKTFGSVIMKKLSLINPSNKQNSFPYRLFCSFIIHHVLVHRYLGVRWTHDVFSKSFPFIIYECLWFGENFVYCGGSKLPSCNWLVNWRQFLLSSIFPTSSPVNQSATINSISGLIIWKQLNNFMKQANIYHKRSYTVTDRDWG